VKAIFDTIPVDVSIAGNFDDIIEEINKPIDPSDIEPLPNDIFELYNEEYRKRRVTSQYKIEESPFIENDPHKNYIREVMTKMLRNVFEERSSNVNDDFDDEFDDEYESDFDYRRNYHNVPQETVRREEPKTGRNDPCPCGSGKKFKKCHGK
jgi:SEC-C motif